MKTKQLPKTDGHIGIGGKIHINLKRVADCAEPGMGGVDQMDFRKNSIGNIAHAVG